MAINVGNLGSPSASRNSRLTEGTWHSFNGRDYTCKIGGIVYDWQKTVGDFIGAQSPTPIFDRASYQTNEITYLDATAEGDLTVKNDMQIEPPLFNANWQDGNGAMISWVSNENNTGVSDDTRVLIGDSIYDLGKPILGAALNGNLILAIHAGDRGTGRAFLCEYKIIGESVVKTREIEISESSIAMTSTPAPVEFDIFLVLIDLYSTWYNPSTTQHVKDNITNLYNNYVSSLPNLQIYFSANARASFSQDLKTVLLHTHSKYGGYSTRLEYDVYHQFLTQEYVEHTNTGKQTNGFMWLSLDTKEFKFKLELEKVFAVPRPEKYSNARTTDIEIFIFAEIVDNQPVWITSDFLGYFNLTDILFNPDGDPYSFIGDMGFFSGGGWVGPWFGTGLAPTTFFRRTVNTNQSRDLFVKMAGSWWRGSCNAEITINKNTINGKSIIGTTNINSYGELKFSSGNLVSYDGEITGETFQGNVINKVSYTDRGKVVDVIGEIKIPVIEVDYIDLRADFSSISISEFDPLYLFREAPLSLKRYVFYLNNELVTQVRKFKSIFSIQNDETDGLPFYLDDSKLREIIFGGDESLPNISINNYTKNFDIYHETIYHFPADRYQVNDFTFRQSSCAYNAEDKTFIYYINGGYCGAFDGTEHIKIESSYIDNHQVDFYYMKLS